MYIGRKEIKDSALYSDWRMREREREREKERAPGYAQTTFSKCYGRRYLNWRKLTNLSSIQASGLMAYVIRKQILWRCINLAKTF